MASGHQLKKLAQQRHAAVHHHGNTCIDCIPKHWSIYTLVFSTASLLTFCFLFYDMQTSSTSVLLHAGTQLGALKTQVEESYLFSSTASPTPKLSPSKVFPESNTTIKAELVAEKPGKTSKVVLSKEDLAEIQSHFEDPKDEDSIDDEPVPEPSDKLDKGDVKEAKQPKEELKHSKEEAKQPKETVGTVKAETEKEEEPVSNVEDDEETVGEFGVKLTEEVPKKGKKEPVPMNEDEEETVGKSGVKLSEEVPEKEKKKPAPKVEVEEETAESGVKLSEEVPKKEKKKPGLEVEVDEEAVGEFGVKDPKKEKEEVESFVEEFSDSEDTAGTEEESSEETSIVDDSIESDGTCDWAVGKWVYDESYPLYKPGTCPLIDGGFRCVENGRPSDEFQKWRWQPDGCDLPKFDAKDILERLRNKRLVFVGDSIGRNNWESMLCMLSEVVTNKSKVYEVNGEAISKHSGFLIYRFADYNCTVEYYRAPHLVPQGRAPPNSGPKVRSTLKLDVMDWSANKWRAADVVVLNSGHWWSFEKTVRGGNYFQIKKTVMMNMTVGEAFERAMKTVAWWIEHNMDPKSQVFFRSYAPVHFKGGTWDHGGTCHNDQKPLQKFPFVWSDRTPSPMIARTVDVNVKVPINFVNVTYLSDLRPDGHSSIYQRVPSSPRNHQDCSHWCLPGVPDTWNEILLATLLKNGQGPWGDLKANI